MSQIGQKKLPQKDSKSNGMAAGTERDSPNGEFPWLELPKGCIPPKHQEMLPDQPGSLLIHTIHSLEMSL